MNLKPKLLILPLLSSCILNNAFAGSDGYSVDVRSSKEYNFVNFSAANGYCAKDAIFNAVDIQDVNAECSWHYTKIKSNGDKDTEADKMHAQIKSMGVGSSDDGKELTEFEARYKNLGLKVIVNPTTSTGNNCLYESDNALGNGYNVCIKTRDYGDSSPEVICNVESTGSDGYLTGVELVVTDFNLPRNIPLLQTYFNPGSLTMHSYGRLSREEKEGALVSSMTALGYQNAGQLYEQLNQLIDTSSTADDDYTVQDYNGYKVDNGDATQGDEFLSGFICLTANAADRIYMDNRDTNKYYDITFLDEDGNELSNVNGDSTFRLDKDSGYSIPPIVGTVATVHFMKEENSNKTKDKEIDETNATIGSKQYQYLADDGSVQTATGVLTTGIYIRIQPD